MNCDSVLYAAKAFFLQSKLQILSRSLTFGRFSHPPSKSTMTLSVATLVWTLPLNQSEMTITFEGFLIVTSRILLLFRSSYKSLPQKKHRNHKINFQDITKQSTNFRFLRQPAKKCCELMSCNSVTKETRNHNTRKVLDNDHQRKTKLGKLHR